MASARPDCLCAMSSLLEHPLRAAEFLVLDTETNGRPGDGCELTEVGTVLVGGGELHERWGTLVRPLAPLGRGIQRFTGITQAISEGAPEPATVLPELAARIRGRVVVAHNAAFDRRVLTQAFDRVGLAWPDPPLMCTVALARRLLPLQRQRALGALAEALGIEVELAHRALADAETCARVLCALFPKLCAASATVGEALALLRGRRSRPSTARRAPRPPGARRARAELDFAHLPRDPGVYLFRAGDGRVLYVGKSVSIRSRVRAHFAPGASAGEWTAQAEVVDYHATHSEVAALLLESRLIKELSPVGNVRGRSTEKLVYLRCRLDVAFPVLELAAEPAAGHGLSVGPLRGRRAAGELVEQLNSLFGLRHCGRSLPRREHPSAYGQMGRCLSPCLGDLDPNLYRRRLDEALALFMGAGDGREALLGHMEGQMRAAAAARHYERAAWLHRRLGRLRALLDRLDGTLRATHARPRLVLARHPTAPRGDAFWLAGGRIADRTPLTDAEEVAARTERVLGRLAPVGAVADVGALLPAPELDEVRIVENWLAARPETPVLPLDPPPAARRVGDFVRAARLNA